jgi:lysophospholipase L1-like esterase
VTAPGPVTANAGSAAGEPREGQGAASVEEHVGRFRELADATACNLYDPLPDLLKLSAEDRGNLWSDSSGHPSGRGHEILANLLAPVLQRLRAGEGQRATK